MSKRALLFSFFAGLIAAGTIAAMLIIARDDDSADERRAVRSYLEAIEPLAREGGEVVQLGLKPGITDLGQRDYNEALLRTQTAAWLRDLESIRFRWAELTNPQDWDAIQRTFLAALDGYVAAASTLSEAVGLPDGDRRALVEAAARDGEAADDTWDEAALALQNDLTELGLKPVTWLPRN